MSGRALEAAVDALHGVICGALGDELEHHVAQLALNPQRVIDYDAAMASYQLSLDEWEDSGRDPDTKPKEPRSLVIYQIPPQFLNQVLKFLGQNGVSAPRATPKVDALAAQLADLDLDGEATQLRHH